ncbi:MAG: hypothetical protein WEB06_12920 [Actinomycetota bacterium]
MTTTEEAGRLRRREFLGLVGKRGIQAGLVGASLPAFLSACSKEDPVVALKKSPASTQGSPIVGDVVDHALTSKEWEGAFGLVTFRLHRGVVEGKDVFFIRTDASDEAYAKAEKLVWVPKLSGLASRGPAGDAYLVTGGTADQAVVLSSEPGRTDFTPAWRINRVSWQAEPRPLRSVAEVKAAETKGDVSVERTSIVMNGPVVKWSTGELPVDTERKVYLGGGQLLEPPDATAMRVMFKLHECFPGVRYIVTDVSLKPMSEGMKIAHSAALNGASGARATGRTNVFMNGMKGSGPMGFQPSVFDTSAGSPAWSPYWDHVTWAWNAGRTAKILRDEGSVLAAEQAGDLKKFPGTPDTKGEIFVVNCPVPVLAPNTV